MEVATRYGKGSLQYMQAGGKPRKGSIPPLSITNTILPTVPTPERVKKVVLNSSMKWNEVLFHTPLFHIQNQQRRKNKW